MSSICVLQKRRGVSDQIEHWFSYAIYGCTQAQAGFEAPRNTLLSYSPKTNRLYVHLLDYPMKDFQMSDFNGKVKYAQLLHGTSEIKIHLQD
ncbi:MAG: hypothetical protein ABJG41_00620 [Cyclobacteriaceae bacterium]